MAHFLGLDVWNYSYYTIPAAFVAVALPHIYSVLKSGKQYDNANPRTMKTTIANNETMDKLTKNRILRAKAASENGFETLSFFATAVVAANQAGLDTRTLNVLTVGYVLSRFAYDYAYIWLCENRRLSFVRSLFWGVGMGFTIALYVKAGNVMVNRL